MNINNAKCNRNVAPVFLLILITITTSCLLPYQLDSIFGRNAGRELTLLIYMSADNELEPYALEDMRALESSGLILPNISILVLLDRPCGAQLYLVNTAAEVNYGSITSPALPLPELGLVENGPVPVNMGNPESLKAFIRYSVSHYPAEQYGIIIWGHGSGWRFGGSTSDSAGLSLFRATSFDDGATDALYTAQLADALAELPRISSSIWAVVAFECCSAMMMETLFEIRDLAEYAVGSQDVLASPGWDYAQFAEALRTVNATSPFELANVLFTQFVDSCGGYEKAAFSVVDLSQLEALNQRWNSLCHLIMDSFTEQEIQQILRPCLLYDVESFFTVPGDLNIDMYNAAVVLRSRFPILTRASFAVLVAIMDAVVLQYCSSNGNPDAGGIAIHFVPLDSNGAALLPHSQAYSDSSGLEDYSLQFIENSLWPPVTGGLLKSMWYQH